MVKTAMAVAGVETGIFKAHSVPIASTGAAANAGIPIEVTLGTAGWLFERTFDKFHRRHLPVPGDCTSSAAFADDPQNLAAKA